MRNLTSTTALLVALLLGCQPARPVAPPAKAALGSKPRVQGHRWGEPFDWVNDPPAVAPIEFEEIQFQHPEVRRAVLRWQTAAASLHGSDWFHRSWYRSPQFNYGAIQWWSSMPESVEPKGCLEGGADSKSGPLHHVRIEVISNTSLESIESATLTADWMPPDRGWGAHFYGSSGSGGPGHAMLWFYPRCEGVDQEFRYWPGLVSWQHHATINDVEYEFGVAVVEDCAMSAPLESEVLLQWASSADALRDAGHAMLDKLEAALREQIPSGEAAHTVKVTHDRFANPPEPPEFLEYPGEYPLTAGELETVLEASLADIAQRRKVLSEHFAGMHAALTAVFPLEQYAP